MPGYTVGGSSAGNSVKTTVGCSVASSGPRRAFFTSAEFGFTVVASAAPIWILQRSTAAATGTSQTPIGDDPADIASTVTAIVAATADPTLTAAAFELWWPLYQNNSARWVAENDRQRKIVPATASNGLALGLSATNTTISGGSLHWEE
jgi:hypothetical protein